MLKRVKCSITSAKMNAERYAKPLTMLTATVGTALSTSVAFAAPDPSGLMKTIIEIMAGLVIALAVIMLVMGIIHYASAHSEGDGPAKSKAIGQLAAAVMLISVSITLTAMSDELASYIAGP